MVKKMNSESLDLNSLNIDKLKKLFPEVLSDGNKIDFDKLKEFLSEEIDDSPDRYNFTWNGKKDAVRVANETTTGTLLPNKGKSKNWDDTENLYIEGDNLETLKILQKSYSNKVKVIYIDPPYNTGKDLVYKDSFKDDTENYLEQTGQNDSSGNKLSTNSENNGRFHTNWLNMMYPRLILARNLLEDDGVIFISIDDHEDANLRKICDEIFGENNFLAQIIWERAYAPVNLKKNFSNSHDYILVYGKNKSLINTNGIKRSDETDSRYNNPDDDSRGVWQSDNLSVGPAVDKNIYPITTPSGRIVNPPSGTSWRMSYNNFKNQVNDNRIWFGQNGDGVPRIKRFKSELIKPGITPMTIWKYSDVDHSQGATQKLKKLMGNKKYFDYPKPVKLVQRAIQLYSNKDSVVLDFFSGSATTADAVMQQNFEDNGNRKFIMVQLPEKTKEGSTAYKDGFKYISSIAEERIRRAGSNIDKEDPENNVDTGFKTFELNKSNIKEWNTDPSKLSEQLDHFNLDNGNNWVEGRNNDDVVYELLLKQGLELTDHIDKQSFKSFDIYNVDYGSLLIILGSNINENIIEYINKQETYFDKELTSFIFQDTGFDNDPVKLNIFESLKNNGYKDENIFTV